MKRLPFVALAVAAACGRSTQVELAPADRFYRPTGIGVFAGNLVVASSNADLRFDPDEGGTVIAVDPDAPGGPRLAGTLPIQSFAGQMAIADPAVCPLVADAAAGALAVLPVRGADQIYRVRVAPDGALSCDGCGVPIGTAAAADPFAVGLACDAGMSRAYVGYLRAELGLSFITQVDLAMSPSDPAALETRALASRGQVQAFAFDDETDRLYFTRSATDSEGALDWIELGGGCGFAGGCPAGTTALGIPAGVELRGLALSSGSVPHRRVYVVGRVYDPVAALAAGIAVGDFDGVLLVADLVEDLAGNLEVRVVRRLSLGFGAADLLRLPAAGGARAGLRDVVVALAPDAGVLWVYDDETGELTSFGRDLERPPGGGDPTGAPLVGHSPFGLAADPRAAAARVYVGSFDESRVTAIDVPYADPAAACLVADLTRDFPGSCGAPTRIEGGTR